MIDDTDLRISVAEIKGMLTATLARHDERLRGLEEDNSARWSRVLGVLALVASGIGVLYSILNP